MFSRDGATTDAGSSDGRRASGPAAREAAPSRSSIRAGRFTARLHRHLDEVEDCWRDLEAAGRLTAFQQLSWMRAMCEALIDPARETLIVVAVADRETGRTVMLMPMLEVRRATHTTITWLDLEVSDYAGPILAPALDLDEATAREAWVAARAALPKADLIHITRIPGRFSGVPNPLAALASRRLMDMQAFAVAMPGEAATLIQRLAQPSVFRELKRRRRKLAEVGEVAFVVASSAAEVDAIFDALLAQRRDRFLAVGRFNLLDRPHVAGFYRSAAHQGLAGGPVRIMALSVGGTCIAAVYGLVHDNAFHMVIPTMADGRWRIYAPGLQSIAAAMEWAHGQGFGTFDFTIGHQRFKTDLGGTPSSLFEVYEAMTLKGYAIMRVLQAKAATKAWLQRRPALFAALRAVRQRLRRLKA